jgi:EAL domain-containing protein (putative c-di-GMP-specific phosphodiesterase class I)
MIAVFVNMATVIAGSLLGILLRNRLKESMQNALLRALGLCTALIGMQSALGTRELLCVILCMAVGTALGALLRIDDEEFRGVSPEVYIPIAEKSGLIREIGMFVFAEVCRFLRDHAKDADALEYIELNLSVYQFMYDNLAESFEEIRSGFDVSASRLNIEITESASEQATAGMAEAMEELRALGYTFSLDDFGTGYSNLSRLVNGGYLNIKIDRSLLWDADRNPDARRLLNSLIQIIRKLGYNVVQEGVETPAQLERVSEAGCNLIHGYYFSRPLPEADFLRYLRAERELPEKSMENNN